MLNYLNRRPKCHVDLPMAQCDMGREVVETQEKWEDIWFTLSKLHWENQIEGLLECMKSFVHPEAFKYRRHPSYGSSLTVSALTLVLAVLLLI